MHSYKTIMDQYGNVYLTYDKTANSISSYNNKITKNFTVDVLFLSDYKYIENVNAIEKYNKSSPNVTQIPQNLDMTLYTPYYFAFTTPNNDAVEIMIVSVDSKLLEQIIDEKTVIPNEDFLKLLCKNNTLYNRTTSVSTAIQPMEITKRSNDIAKEAMKPNGDPTDQLEEQPEYATIPLYDYQKRTIKWMVDKENNSENIYYSLSYETVIGNVVFDNIKQQFGFASNRPCVNFKGGALIDEVGLGKTYQMIIASMINSAKNINYIQSERDGLCSRATLIICPNQLAIQWTKELDKVISENYGLSVIPFFTKVHFDKYTYQDLLDADFVITSFTFLDNKCFTNLWLKKTVKKSQADSSEIVQELDEMRKKIGLTNIFDVGANMLLINWHRIIVDEFHEMFTSVKGQYIAKVLKLFKAVNNWCLTGTPFDKSSECLINMIDFVSKYTNVLGDKILLCNNVFDHVEKNFFRRNTKQSIQTEYTLKPIQYVIVKLDFSKTEWMIYNAFVADPTIDRFSTSIRQLCCHPKIANDIKLSISKCSTMDEIEKIMISHFKEKMNQSFIQLKYTDFRMRKIKRNIKIMEWRRQRKFLRQLGYYVEVDFKEDAKDIKECKQMETELKQYPELAALLENNNFEEFENPFAESDDDNAQPNSKGKKKIIISDENQNKILALVYDLATANQSQTLINTQELYKQITQKFAQQKGEYEGKKKTCDYFNGVVDKLKKTTKVIDSESDSDSDVDETKQKESCIICLGKVKGACLGVTICGHIFCHSCITNYVATSGKCPSCNKHIQGKDIFKVTEKMPDKKDEEEFKDKQTLINTVGTKLANLIFFLKKNDKHAIIFSQWDDLLRVVGNVLDDYGIKNVFCRGNVWQRNKAVKEFNDNDNVKIIMLSSESAASGTNLTKAEMVILLDPVHGTYEYRRNTEWQAIGRAYRMGQTKNVQVVRFIIRDTVEEEIFKANQQHDKIEGYKEISGNMISLDQAKLEEIIDASKTVKKIKETKGTKNTSLEKLQKKTKKQMKEEEEEIYNDNNDNDSEASYVYNPADFE